MLLYRVYYILLSFVLIYVHELYVLIMPSEQK